MEILIIASSFSEIQPLVGQMELIKNLNAKYARFRFLNQELDILIAGFGSGITSYHLTSALLRKSYDRVLVAGRCYALNPTLAVGKIVHVLDDQFGDMGYWGNDGFQSVFESGMIRVDEFPFQRGVLENNEEFSPSINKLPKVTGLTLNAMTNHLARIEVLKRKFMADEVSMNGATAFYCCMQEKVACFQVRVVAGLMKEMENLEAIDPQYANELCTRLEHIIKEWWEEEPV
jgi:nucleoside phosphorylase